MFSGTQVYFQFLLFFPEQVGLLSVHYPIVNFQEKTKNAKKKLLKLVRERLGEQDDAETVKAQKDQTNERNKNLSFQVIVVFI